MERSITYAESYAENDINILGLIDAVSFGCLGCRDFDFAADEDINALISINIKFLVIFES